MATSPIYGWLEPDNTDLVKNGALAIRTLGNAIDTTMGTMTPKSIVDAKGDLIAASANDTPARLAVGANGETLVADSSTSTGLRYTAGLSVSNAILNSAMQVWQRGTSFVPTSGGIYTADRWQAYRATNGSTVSRQAAQNSDLPNVQYCMRVQRDSGNTATGEVYLAQSVETINAIPYAGKTVTFSWYARRGANFSATSNLQSFRVKTGTGTDQNGLLTTYTGEVTPINTSVTLTTTWQRFSATATFDATVTEFTPLFFFAPTGTAGAADYFDFTGVQIDIGSVALPFRTNGATIQGELAACQRYYQRFTGNTFTNFGIANAPSTTAGSASVPLLTAMRTTPTSIDYGGGIRLTDQVANFTVTAITLISIESSPQRLQVTATSSSLTQFRMYFLSASSDAAAFLGVSAEL